MLLVLAHSPALREPTDGSFRDPAPRERAAESLRFRWESNPLEIDAREEIVEIADGSPLAPRLGWMLDYLDAPSETFLDPHALPAPVYP